MNVTVTNDSTTTSNGWTIALDFGEAPQVTNSWNAELASEGNVVTASSIGWNGNLSAGGSTSFGLQGNSDGNVTTPICIGL